MIDILQPLLLQQIQRILLVPLSIIVFVHSNVSSSKEIWWKQVSKPMVALWGGAFARSNRGWVWPANHEV